MRRSFVSFSQPLDHYERKALHDAIRYAEVIGGGADVMVAYYEERKREAIESAARLAKANKALSAMRSPLLLSLLLLAGCSHPTAPTPITPPVAAAPVTPVAPPVSTPPPVVAAPTPPPNPLLSDPRYSASFYRDFVLGARDGGPYTLRRQTQAPRIYLRTIDDAGAAIDTSTLEQTAAAIINTAGKLTGVFGLAGMERGTGSREGDTGWITVRWSAVVDPAACGRATVGGGLITLYPKTPECRCAGGPAVRLVTVKHELGHALGFWHTDSVDDLMHPGGTGHCDKEPSTREIFHAGIAYSQPVGSTDPR